MKKKTLETLTNELNRLVHKRETSQKKLYTNIGEVESFYVLYDKVVQVAQIINCTDKETF